MGLVIYPNGDIYAENALEYNQEQKQYLFGRLEPGVRATIVYVGGGDDAIEEVCEDATYIYWLSEIVSHQCVITFEDGTLMSVREAVDGEYIIGQDLVLNGMNNLRVRRKQP